MEQLVKNSIYYVLTLCCVSKKGIIRLTSFFIFFHFVYCGSQNMEQAVSQEEMAKISESITYQNEVFYNTDIFIPFNYELNGEALNKPVRVKYNPISNNVLILDGGNHCLYEFDVTGNFIKRIGSIGQGPGEFLRPNLLDVDKSGKIYVYENGNFRVSILDSNGEFIHSFRTSPYGFPKSMQVFNNKELVFNFFNSKYYITIYSLEGKIIKELGEIKKFNSSYKLFDSYYAEGHTFKDDQGVYYAFLHDYFRVVMFDAEGNIVREVPMDEILPVNHYKPWIKTPEAQLEQVRRKSGFSSMKYIQDIILKNGKFYVMLMGESALRRSNLSEEPIPLIVLDRDLKVIETMQITFADESHMDVLNPLSFELLNSQENDVFINTPQSSRIHYFKTNK